MEVTLLAPNFFSRKGCLNQFDVAMLFVNDVSKFKAYLETHCQIYFIAF